jgi:hypothetical protein
MRQYAAATVDEDWAAQLPATGSAVWWARDDEFVSGLADREGGTRADAIALSW